MPCVALGVAGAPDAPPGLAFVPARALVPRLDDAALGLVARALMLVGWQRTSRFCGRCGTPTGPEPGERARRCPRCGLLDYPRVAPVAIVRVTRGDRLLLARGERFPPGFFSVLAGFVEPGESIEETVAREIREEVGIQVDAVRYVASQPWPFPHSLMLGFTAEHAGGELVADGVEILEAGWFGVDELPRLPPRPSIARRLIDAWIVSLGRDPSGQSDW